MCRRRRSGMEEGELPVAGGRRLQYGAGVEWRRLGVGGGGDWEEDELGCRGTGRNRGGALVAVKGIWRGGKRARLHWTWWRGNGTERRNTY